MPDPIFTPNAAESLSPSLNLDESKEINPQAREILSAQSPMSQFEKVEPNYVDAGGAKKIDLNAREALGGFPSPMSAFEKVPARSLPGFEKADDLDVKSVDELNADRTNFNPVSYFEANPNLPKDPKRLAKLLEVARLRYDEGLKASEVAKDIFSKETGTTLANIGGGIKRFGERAIDVTVQPISNVILGTLTGDLFDEQKRNALFNQTRKIIKKGTAEVSAGSESASVGIVDLSRQGIRKADAAYTPIPLSAMGDFSPQESIPLKKPLTDQEVLRQLSDDVAFRQNAAEILRGEGEAAKKIGLDKETLAKQGITLDEKAIEQLSLVDPITMVATGGAFKLIGLGGKLLGTARTLEGVQYAAGKLADLAKYSAGKGIQYTGTATKFAGEALKGSGRTAALITGVGASVRGAGPAEAIAVAAATKAVGPAVRFIGAQAEHFGKAIAGEVPVSATAQKIIDYAAIPGRAATTISRGALTGIAAAAPFAVMADEDAQAGALLGAGAALGAGHAVGAGAFRVVKDAASRRYFGENRPVLEDVPSPAYGKDSDLDAQHTANVQKLSAQDSSELNNFREALRQQGGEIYAVDRTTFRQKVAETMPDVTPEQLDIYENHSAFFDESKGDRKIVYLNSDTTGLQHDAGHIFDAILSPEKRAELRSAVEETFSPEQRAKFRETYERRVGSKITDKAAVDEFIAEQFAALFNNVPVTELAAPESLLNKFIDTVAEGAEALGIDLSAGATTPNLGAPVAVGIRKLFQNAAGDVMRANTNITPPIDFAGNPPAPSTPPVAPASPTSPIPVDFKGKAAAPPPPVTPDTNLRAAPTEVSKFQTPTLTQTPGAREAAATRYAETGIDMARAEAKKNDGSPNSQIIERISDAMESGSPVVQIEHLGFTSKSKPEATIGKKPRRKEREAGQVKLAKLNLTEGRAEAPADVISKHSKTFVPYKWEKHGNTLKLTAMSIDKVIENIKALSEAASDPKIAELIPYPVENGRITDEGWRQVVADTQAYSENQANGRMGDGNKLNVPEIGLSVPAQNPSYTPKMLTPERANFQNLLQGLDVPSTGSSPLEIPANAKGQIFAEANLRPTETPVNIPAKKLAKQGFKNPALSGRTVQEVNPLRNELKRRGFDVGNLSEVTEVLNARDITSATPRPDLKYKAPITDVIRGGFLPYYPKSELDAHIIALANGKESAFKAPKDIHFIGQYNSEGKLIGAVESFFNTPHDAGVTLKTLPTPAGTSFKVVSMSLEQYKKDFYKGSELPPESKTVARGSAGHIPNSFDALDAHISGEKPLAGPLPEQLHYLQFRDAQGNSAGTSETYFSSPEAAQKALAEYRPPSGVTGKAEVLPYDTYKNNLLGEQLYYLQFRDAQGSPTGTSGRMPSRYFSSQEEAQKAISEFTLREGDTATVESTNAYKENQYEIKINKDSISKIKDYLKTAATEGPMTDETFVENYHDGYFDVAGGLSFEELNKRFPDAGFREEYADLNKEFTEETNSADAEVSKKFTDAAGDYQKEKDAAGYARQRYNDIHEHLNSRLWELQRNEPIPKRPEDITLSYSPKVLWASPDGTLYTSNYPNFAEQFLGGSENKAKTSGWVKIEVDPINVPKGAGHISVENKGGLTPPQQDSISRLSKVTKYEAVDAAGNSLTKVAPAKASDSFLTQKSLEAVDWSEIRRDLQALDPKEAEAKFGINVHYVEDLIESLSLRPEKSPNSFPKEFQGALKILFKEGRKQLLDRGESPGMFLPAPTEFRQKNLGGRTVEEFSDYILKSSPTEWKAATDNMTGGLTGGAWNLGLGLKNAADVGVLKSYADKFSDSAKAAMKAGDFDLAFSNVTRGQFFREAYEAATGTGSAGAAFKRGTAGMESAKPPFPAETTTTGTTSGASGDATRFQPAEELAVGETELRPELKVLPAAPGGTPPTEPPTFRPPPVAAGVARQEEDKATFQPRTEAGRKLEEKGYEIVASGEMGIRRVSVVKDGDEFAAIQSVQRSPKKAEISMVQKYKGAPKGIGEVLYRELGAQLKDDGVTLVEGQVISPEPLAIRKKIFGDFARLDVNGEPATYAEALAATERVKNRTETSMDVVEPASTISAATRFAPGRRDAQGRPLDKEGEIDYARWQAEGIAARKKQRAESDKAPSIKEVGPLVKETEPKSSTGWILPDKKFVPLDTNFHEQYLAENSDSLNKKFGTKFSADESSGDDRLAAVNAGFVRFRNYNGRLSIEANADKWSSLKSKVLETLQDVEGQVDSLTISLLNTKGQQVDSTSALRLHEMTGPGKLDAIEEAVSSIRSSGPRFQPSEERVTAAAVKDASGEIHTGPTHAFIAAKGEDGFVTNTGRFVGRQEAFEIGLKAGQVPDRQYAAPPDAPADYTRDAFHEDFNGGRFAPGGAERTPSGKLQMKTPQIGLDFGAEIRDVVKKKK